MNYNETWIQLVVKTSKTSITSGRNLIYQIWREKACCNIWYWRVLLYLVKTDWNWKPNLKLYSYWKIILLFPSLVPKGSSFSERAFLFWYKLHVPLMVYTRAICFLTYKDPFEAFSHRVAWRLPLPPTLPQPPSEALQSGKRVETHPIAESRNARG